MNDLPGTIEMLRSLVAENPESAMLNSTFANTLKETGDFGRAIAHFEKAVQLAPQSELYSLGLFHVLWGKGCEKKRSMRQSAS